ncbi:MAG TPA: phosphatase PAP2 family protein [Acidimicrobiales bacterium]|nr:phosphatase PAP2 family protein [Acidimicrobiales bacterium]
MLLNHRRAGRLAFVFVVLGALLLAAVAYSSTLSVVQEVDDAWRSLMIDLRVSPLVWVAKVLAFVGSPWINWPLRVAALALLAVKRRWVQLTAFALAIVTSELLIGPVKALYERPRPPASVVATHGFSFPSGHAVAGAVTAVGLVLVLLPPGPRRWAWEVRAAIYASLMALSRTYLGVHWLSDVLAGGLLGVGLAVGWPALLQEIRDVRLPRRRARAPS